VPYLGILGVLGLWFLTYGMGEEIGWRGYALPHLQRTRPAASAALLLGVLWACWHLPAFFFRDTYVEMGLSGFAMFVVSICFASVVFAWLYNSTGGSLLLVILFHVFFNGYRFPKPAVLRRHPHECAPVAGHLCGAAPRA
jgi:membrane protease YdiL (CAAX protease family)